MWITHTRTHTLVYPTSLRASTSCMPQCTRVLARSLSRASTRAVPERCYRYRAPGCRARSFHRRCAVHTYAGISSRRCGRHRYIPAPGTNIIACRDKFIAGAPLAPQPLANVPRLQRKTSARKGRRRWRRVEIRKGEKGKKVNPRVDLWTFRGIYSGGRYITRYTRCPGDNSARVSANIMHTGRAEIAKKCLAGTPRENARCMRIRSLKEDNKSDGNSSFHYRAALPGICPPLDDYSLTR